jgi:hypothetical protein
MPVSPYLLRIIQKQAQASEPTEISISSIISHERSKIEYL